MGSHSASRSSLQLVPLGQFVSLSPIGWLSFSIEFGEAASPGPI
jgi:hypothetical protein